MYRLFIETDILQKDELRRAQRRVEEILDQQGIKNYPADIFDETVDFAWHEPEKAWEAVLRADEIYGDSSLVPLCGYGSYTGSVVVMDVMMKKAIEQKIKGKSLIFLRKFKDLHWEGIDYKLLSKAFKNNKLFTLEYGTNYVLMPVDIKNLIKYIKSK